MKAGNNAGSYAEGIISADPGTPLLKKNNRERLPITKLLGKSKGFVFVSQFAAYYRNFEGDVIMSRFFEDIMQGLLEAVSINKGEIHLLKKKDMSAPTFIPSEREKLQNDSLHL